MGSFFMPCRTALGTARNGRSKLSDTAASEAPETAAQETTQPTQSPPDKPDAKPADPKPTETVDFWKAKSREWETRSKANSDAAKRLAEIEEANKSAEQKAAEAHAAAEKRAADAERALLRFRVAAKAGLDADLAERLRGDSEDELLADAQGLKAKFAPPAPSKSQPKPDPSQGARQPVKPSTATGRDLWAQRHPTRSK